MSDLVVIAPSRGRPEAAAELAQAFKTTCVAATVLLFAIDEDDPARSDYLSIVGDASAEGQLAGMVTTASKNMVQALNSAAAMAVDSGQSEHVGRLRRLLSQQSWHGAVPFAIGFMGDDHRPRTLGWDKQYLETLRELGTGIVYGNDLLQGENLPTQCAMTSDIIRAIGYMAPPELTHLAVDNFWLDLGRAAGCIRYLPDVVVEHMHPIAGKSEWTEGHLRVNAQSMYDRDLAQYALYRRVQLPGVAAKVRALRGDA